MTPLAIDREDHLGLLDAQLEIVRSRVALTALPLPEQIAHRRVLAGPTNEAGGVDVRSFTGDKIERLTAYRFHREEVLNEHLFHAWPEQGYDYPALTTVIFEMPALLVVGADLVPIADIAFDPTYYARYLEGYSHLVAARWPTLVAHRVGPEPPPDPYFTHQLGSRLSLLMYLEPAALELARSFLIEVTELWGGVRAAALPTPDVRARRTEDRRVALMRSAYKGLDYHSPASAGIASVLGWEGANLMFDTVFGVDEVEQRPLDRPRRYLDVALSPGTDGRPRSISLR